MLGFASQRRLEELEKAHMALEHAVSQLERKVPEMVAALENAADLYNRAAARAERSKPHGGGGSVGAVGSIEELRRRRGGV